MTDCNNSMAPNDEELLSYALDDEPLPREKEGHLAYCFICQQRLDDYKRTHAYLLTRLYRTQCPSATMLNYYCADLLAMDQVPSIESHLHACPLCANEVAMIRQTLANFDPFPPEDEASAMPITARHIIASPVPQRRTSAAARSIIREGEWSQQYRAEALGILLQFSYSSNGDNLLLGVFSNGYVVSETNTCEGIVVDLYRAVDFQLMQGLARPSSPSQQHSTMPLQITQIDDLGNIVFNAIPGGKYTMVVHLPDCDVIIEDLTIS
ncbi:MAG: hypothetical protein JO125_16925 [Chloroflexi bacterium]|nr:hypothetical protein [Ktedonobacteraceae bacterium]MBV9021400.1 hypothetical protein [Ktedonobacteraceae bacterium]MBV9709080.1 hypothetical protein [Chloroflexota bacterium]